jgi:hypothetical protein
MLVDENATNFKDYQWNLIVVFCQYIVVFNIYIFLGEAQKIRDFPKS